MSIRFSTAYRRIKKVLDDLTDTYSEDMKEAYEKGYKVGFTHAKTDLIVRCKDCKYNRGDHKCLNPDSIIIIPDDNDFCSYGERR